MARSCQASCASRCSRGLSVAASKCVDRAAQGGMEALLNHPEIVPAGQLNGDSIDHERLAGPF